MKIFTDKKNFICYAKESFEGKPTTYDVAFYDDEPKLDTVDPTISLDIKFAGSLTNPFDRASLESFCLEHSVILKDNQPKDELDTARHYDEAAVVEALIANESDAATEAGLVDKVKQLVTNNAVINKHQVQKNLKNYSSLDGAFKRNEENIQAVLSSKKVTPTHFKPEEAARYFADQIRGTDNPDGLPDYFMLTYDKTTGTTKVNLSNELGSDIDQCIVALKDVDDRVDATALGASQQIKEFKDKLLTQLATKMLRVIKTAANKMTVVGYTFNAELANKFKRDNTDEDADPSEGLDGTYTPNTDPRVLNKAWDDAGTVAARSNILAGILKSAKVSNLDRAVTTSLVSIDSPFTKVSGGVVLYQLKQGKGVSENVWNYLMKNNQIRELVAKQGLEGLDFSEEDQFGCIQITLKLADLGNSKIVACIERIRETERDGLPPFVKVHRKATKNKISYTPINFTGELFKNGKWKSPEEMKEVYTFAKKILEVAKDYNSWYDKAKYGNLLDQNADDTANADNQPAKPTGEVSKKKQRLLDRLASVPDDLLESLVQQLTSRKN